MRLFFRVDMSRAAPSSSHGAGNTTERWVSVEDVAAHVGVRKDSIYRWIESRGLPAQKIGKLWKLRLSEVDAWMTAGGARGSGEDPEASPHPALRQGGIPAAAASNPSSQIALPHSVLIVDDDEALRDTLRDVVSDQGYGALCAPDGIEALRLLRSSDHPRPSLILLDVYMPNMDGLEFLREQRRDPDLAAIPVIIITAERGSDISGASILRKPLDLARLADTIRGAIG